MNTKKEKYMKFIVLATRIIAMVSAIGFSSMCISAQNFDNFAEIIKFSLYTIPLNLVTGLYGYVMGMICFVVIYLTLLIRDLEYAYTAVYALVSISMVAWFMMRNTYKTKRGAFLSFIYFYLSTTILFYLIYGMLGLASFSNISFDNLTGGLLNGAMMTFANSILITITLYYLTKYENSFFVRAFLPDVWSDARSRLAIKHRKRTVESHIDALIIVVVCFSGFATAGYVNGLVPNLNVAVINEDGEIANIINDTEVDSDTSDNGDSENSDSENSEESENKPSTPWGIFDFDNTFSVSSTGRKLKFQFTDILLAFDIKLVLMI
ncbi:MAG: hypothetical protein K6B41_00630, partial [Butyrivibrio sp.]|nr:hypothetical protein [Butyrivibrio sp.]